MTRRAGAAREIVKCWKTARAVTPRWCCWRFGLVSRLDKLTASLRNDVARLCEPLRIFCELARVPCRAKHDNNTKRAAKRLGTTVLRLRGRLRPPPPQAA
jgi:hypothetical protein